VTTVNTSPDPGADDKVSLLSNQQGMAALALLSFGAGFLHAAVIKAHEGHGRVATIFTVLAIFQVAWAAAVLAKPHRLVLALGAVVNAAVIGGYIVSRISGIGFIEGLEAKEPIAFTDGVTTGLEVVLVLGIVAYLAAGTKRALWPAGQLGMASVGAVGLVVALLGVPGVSKGAEHSGNGHHAGVETEAAGAHAHDAGAGDEHAGMEGMTDEEHAKMEVEAKPYDPALPIDLSGTPGVTPQQQAEAENLIGATLRDLPQWADPAYAEANGFKSIGDGGTGVEHLVSQAFMDDDSLLDPDRPESLVYNTEGGKRELVAAMYMTKRGVPLADVPKLGGKLMQWHVHDNLCYNSQGRVSGLTNSKGECPKGLVKPVETPMIHVWITKHPCGPFAALEGVGGGRIPEGEERLCDHAHGDGM
jgi:hypothetical protein